MNDIAMKRRFALASQELVKTNNPSWEQISEVMSSMQALIQHWTGKVVEIDITVGGKSPEVASPSGDLLAPWSAGARLQYLVLGGYDDDWTDYISGTPPDLQSERLLWRVSVKAR